jgi:transposase-like protein
MDTPFKAEDQNTQPQVDAELPGRHRLVPPPQPTQTQYDPQRATRRTWTVAEKIRIVERVKGAEYGTIGNILREEGLYSAQYRDWLEQYEAGHLDPQNPKRRGPARQPKDALSKEVARLTAELEISNLKLKQAETLIGLQKKFSEMLECSLR